MVIIKVENSCARDVVTVALKMDEEHVISVDDICGVARIHVPIIRFNGQTSFEDERLDLALLPAAVEEVGVEKSDIFQIVFLVCILGKIVSYKAIDGTFYAASRVC